MTEERAQGNGPIRSIVIVGGGTAGWMAAAKLARYFERRPVAIALVESSEIGTVGVGEATVPAIREFLKDIGLAEYEVMRASNATVKLGIEFDGWAGEGSAFFHPFGLYGVPHRGLPFHQYWLKLHQAGESTPLSDYSLATRMAMAGLFRPPPEKPASDLSVFGWAFHFDAGLFARTLRDFATGLGVKRIDAKIRQAHLRDDGFIESVELESGERIAGDLFVDCSGFRGLLISGALGVDFEDWTHYLPCDRAVTMPCERGGPLTPYTRARARAAGWQWRIPLQNRIGNGYVYCSRYISDDEAAAKLAASLEGKALAPPNRLRFAAGHRRKFWEKNCVAIGLAAGFLEPLESTSIVLIQTGLEKLIALFPDRSFPAGLSDEYNRESTLEYERLRDFLILHYIGNGRAGEAFWDECRRIAPPERLAHKMRVFRDSGVLLRYEWETFFDPSWLSLYVGLGILPDRHNPLADGYTVEDLKTTFGRIRADIQTALGAAMPHADFIARHCRAAL